MIRDPLDAFGKKAAIHRFARPAEAAGAPRDEIPFVLLPGTNSDPGVYGLLEPEILDRPVFSPEWPRQHPLFLDGMDGFATLTWHMLEAVDVAGPVILGGNSFGAMLALHMALKTPERVPAIVLLAGCAAGRQIYPSLRFAHAVTRPVPSWIFAPIFAARRLFSRPIGKRPWLIAATHHPVGPFDGMPREGWDVIMQHVGIWSAAEVQAVLRAFMPWDIRDRVPAMRTRALVVHGTEDRLIPYRAGEWLAGALSNSRFHSMPGVGHCPMITRPAETAVAIRDFLRTAGGA